MAQGSSCPPVFNASDNDKRTLQARYDDCRGKLFASHQYIDCLRAQHRDASNRVAYLEQSRLAFTDIQTSRLVEFILSDLNSEGATCNIRGKVLGMLDLSQFLRNKNAVLTSQLKQMEDQLSATASKWHTDCANLRQVIIQYENTILELRKALEIAGNSSRSGDGHGARQFTPLNRADRRKRNRCEKKGDAPAKAAGEVQLLPKPSVEATEETDMLES